MSLAVIILGGGIGTRMGTSTPKQFLKIQGKETILYSVELLLSLPELGEMVVVSDPLFRSLFSSYKVKFADPGARRQDSLINAVKLLGPNIRWVLIHDGVRPCVSLNSVKNLIEMGKKIKAAALGVPVRYTVKQTDSAQFVQKTLDRSLIFEIQTPQFLERTLLERGIDFATEHGITVTDDVAFAELLGEPVKIVTGESSNIKITVPEDLKIAEHILAH